MSHSSVASGNIAGFVIFYSIKHCFPFVDVKQALIQWQERIDFAHKLLTLLNSYSPPELRNACLGESPAVAYIEV